MYWILSHQADVEGEIKTMRTVCSLKTSSSVMLHNSDPRIEPEVKRCGQINRIRYEHNRAQDERGGMKSP